MIREALTFSDVLLVPKYSEVVSRRDVDLSVNLKGLLYSTPVLAANMKSIVSHELASRSIMRGALTIIHRFMPIEEQLIFVRTMNLLGAFWNKYLGVSVGVKKEDLDGFRKLYEAGVTIVCVDIAHANSKGAVDMVRKLRMGFPDTTIIAGNVATPDGAMRLRDAGADAIKVGVGSGSICLTRTETGNGVPQLQALMDIDARNDGMFIISDGGCSSAGDVCKALSFSSMVMVGNLFAGCEEAPGQIIEIDGRKYKQYVGSSTHKTTHIEGVEAMVPVKGSFNSIMQRLEDGIRSGCSYQGVSKVGDLKKDPQFVRMTAAGLRESGHHDVLVRS